MESQNHEKTAPVICQSLWIISKCESELILPESWKLVQWHPKSNTGSRQSKLTRTAVSRRSSNCSGYISIFSFLCLLQVWAFKTGHVIIHLLSEKKRSAVPADHLLWQRKVPWVPTHHSVAGFFHLAWPWCKILIKDRGKPRLKRTKIPQLLWETLSQHWSIRALEEGFIEREE